MSNGRQGQRPGRGEQRPHQWRGGSAQPIRFEIPRRAAPGYITAVLGDYHTLQSCRTWQDIPPGHRFQIYFHGMADKGEVDAPEDREARNRLRDAAERADWETLGRNQPRTTERWVPLKNQKRVALQAAAGMGKVAADLLSALAARADALRGPDDWRRDAELIAPLATGLGNPHPVENGFAFLSPYGVPYLAGSGIKGVLRRAAEELALFDADSAWSMAHVWALFGFDENSGCFKGDDNAQRWCYAYAGWVERVRERGDTVLDAWLTAIRDQLPRESRDLASAEVLAAFAARTDGLRRAIHWEGLLAVQDAFPDAKATMAVDILNPHHKDYYEAKTVNGRQATPHDAENPVPVFFLTVAPGARFTFAARPLLGREALWRAIGDWKALLDAAFEYARDWLGFGAKTAVGYGALAHDPEAEDRRAGAELRARERAAREAEEARRRSLSPEDLAWEDNLRHIKSFRDEFEKARKSAYKPGCLFDQKRIEFMKLALAWTEPRSRAEAAKLLRETMNKAWGMPSNKESKQRLNDAIATLESPGS